MFSATSAGEYYILRYFFGQSQPQQKESKQKQRDSYIVNNTYACTHM